MAINNFKPFALDPNANVTSQADWEALPALLSGFTAGKASSAQVNKAIRQASFIAAALAQYTANKSGLDVLDDGDLNGFISKMGTAFGKDFQALDATLTALAGLATGANKLPYFTGTDKAAQTDLTSVGRDIIGKSTIADILTYLGLADAIHGVSCDAAGFSGGDTAQPYFRHVDGSLVPLSTHSYTQTGLDGRQPKDATLTNLSGKDVAGLLQYLGLTKAVVVENQGSNANGKWRKYTDGTFEASGFISANPATGIAIVPLPVQFPAAPTTILVTQYIHDTSSRPGLTTVINSLSGATGFQTMSVDLTGAPYALGFAWRATYAPF